MKKLLWLAITVGTLAAAGVAAAAVMKAQKKQLPRRPLALRGLFGIAPAYEVFEAEVIEDDIIEIIPLDVMSGPLTIDPETEAMLEQLSDRAAFLA